MKHGSLFSGGGGFDLAAEMAGWTNVFHCEKDAFCQRLLKYYWPHSATYPDIKEFHGQEYAGQIDVLTGGFPCQPFSTAGKRRGTADDRYLWPEMLRLIGEIAPLWVVGENVLGLTNWDGGLVFRQVLLDLEAKGYEAWPFVLPAAGVNAPHQRYRVWIVARRIYDTGRTNQKNLEKACTDANRHRCDRIYSKGKKYSNKERIHAQHEPMQVGVVAADTNSTRLEGRKNARKTKKHWQKHIEQLAGFCPLGNWRDWPTQSPVCSGDDGFPLQLDGITFPKWRMNSIRLYGNAIVPQIALRIFQAIESYDWQMMP